MQGKEKWDKEGISARPLDVLIYYHFRITNHFQGTRVYSRYPQLATDGTGNLNK